MLPLEIRVGATNEAGFSIIEVLVTCVVIGTLTLLAIPVFAVYKAQSFNTKANTDLHNAITAEEANFDATNNYVTCGPLDCGNVLPGFAPSSGVSLTIQVSGEYFSISACHDGGNRIYAWDSFTGDYVSSTMGASCTPAPPTLP